MSTSAAAHSAVRRALVAGTLIRPATCERCDEVPTGHWPILHAHHDNYARPLQVRWLCRSCHKSGHVTGVRFTKCPVNSSNGREDRICDQCGKPITVDPRATHKRFCSRACKASFHKENRRAGEAARMALKGAA